MQILTATIEEFIECLEDVKEVFENVIRMSLVREPLDGNQKDATKYGVLIQVGTIVINRDSPYQLQCDLDCGVDYEDANPQREGWEKAMAAKEKIEAYAEKRGWKIRPGLIIV